jgi:predicted PurR-regulated permease PerM
MLKSKQNKHYFKIAFFVTASIVSGGVILFLLYNLRTAGRVFASVWTSLTPVWTGIVIAYLLNPLLKLFEEKCKMKRVWAVTCTVITALLALFGFFALVLPQIVSSLFRLSTVLDSIPYYFGQIRDGIGKMFGETSSAYLVLKQPVVDIGERLTELWEGFKPGMLDYLARIGGVAFNFIANFLIGFIIAVNLLDVKEKLARQMGMIVFVVAGKSKSEKIFRFLRRVDDVFRKYLVGLISDAGIVGAICFIVCIGVGADYPLLIGVLIGVTNIIPFFGPFIGTIPAAFIIFMSGGIFKALWFVIFMLILQQIDGNIITPRIQGGAVGVPPFWALIAIITGGGLFGFWGLILATPVFAIIYTLTKEFAEKRINEQLVTEN